MKRQVKICGLTRADDVMAVNEAGADFVGFVHVEESPRFITPQTARQLSRALNPDIKTVSLLVNPDDAQCEYIMNEMRPDYIQLHGTESQTRCVEIKTLTGCAIIKALGVEKAEDVAQAEAYQSHADILLFDAKPPQGEHTSRRTGGHGQRFDWTLMSQYRGGGAWMLSGGLTPDNVRCAMSVTGASIVDVSSGVEATKGLKDAAKIAAFIKAARAI